MRYLKLVVFLVFLVSLSGCFATKKRCLRLYPPIASTDTIVFETVRDSIVTRDTIIYVRLPGETLIDSIFIPQESIPIYSDTLILETPLARAETFYRTPNIHLTLIDKDTTLRIRLDSAIREKLIWKEKYTEILNKEVVEVKHIPVIYKISLWAWIGLILFAIIRVMIGKFKLY